MHDIAVPQVAKSGAPESVRSFVGARSHLRIDDLVCVQI
jgi:hypothetical protein